MTPNNQHDQSARMREAVAGMAELHGRKLGETAAMIFLRALNRYAERDVLKAFDVCLRELRYFPSVADVISRIDDGHPSPDEAWAYVPKSEGDSVCWTDEIRTAYFDAAHRLVEHDEIAARMAFKAAYERALTKARAACRRASWSISYGHDPHARVVCARNAVERGLIAHDQVQHLLEDQSPGHAPALVHQVLRALPNLNPTPKEQPNG